jgi:hypothetical protein
LVPHDVNRGPIFSCGGIDMGKTVGFLCDDSCLDRKVLGMYALLANFANAEDLIANTNVSDAIPNCRNDAGEIPSKNVRKTNKLIRFALTHLPVRAIDTGGNNFKL